MTNGITSIENVIEPRRFAQYVVERTPEKNQLFRAGIVRTSDELARLAASGGRTVELPFWGYLNAEDEILSDSASLTPQLIAASKDVAAVNYRGAAFSANDLAAAVSGSDPMGAIASQVIDFWNARLSVMVGSIMKGIFATALASTHVKNISIEDGNNAASTNLFSATDALETVFKLGDAQGDLSGVLCHSVVYQKMLAQNLIDFIKPSDLPKEVPTYMGRQVIVDDGAPKVAGGTSGWKYYTLFFGPGALAFGELPAPKGAEVDRDSLAGNDYLITRRHFILHPAGVKWVGTAAGTTPSNTELATGSNWSKVYQDKAIKIAALISNG